MLIAILLVVPKIRDESAVKVNRENFINILTIIFSDKEANRG